MLGKVFLCPSERNGTMPFFELVFAISRNQSNSRLVALSLLEWQVGLWPIIGVVSISSPWKRTCLVFWLVVSHLLGLSVGNIKKKLMFLLCYRVAKVNSNSSILIVCICSEPLDAILISLWDSLSGALQQQSEFWCEWLYSRVLQIFRELDFGGNKFLQLNWI